MGSLSIRVDSIHALWYTEGLLLVALFVLLLEEELLDVQCAASGKKFKL